MSKIEQRLSATGGLILAVKGWFCVCTSCGQQWFTAQKEQPDTCTRCKVRHEHAERSVADFKKKAREGTWEKDPSFY